MEFSLHRSGGQEGGPVKEVKTSESTAAHNNHEDPPHAKQDTSVVQVKIVHIN